MKAVKKNPVKTVLTISVGFGVIFLFYDVRWCIYTSITVGILGLISNKIAEFIDFLWMKLAKVLSYIIPNILLSVIFYVILYPLSIFSRIFGNKDYLQLKRKNTTLWINTSTQNDPNTFEKMW